MPGHAQSPALVAIIVGAVLLPGCTAGSPASASPTTADFSAETRFCAEEVNRYRALVGLPELDRSPALEQYATESARVDGMSRQAHRHFSDTNGDGVAMAETELLLWPKRDVRTIIQQGFKMMWNEGPAGDHYQVMFGSYGNVGCGVFADGSLVTVAQDFR